ncbi:MAG: hypothetical protein IKS59_00040 [Aeriscardovia sp.]|nr:hypothetical protein [Aeriscardovia sp.]
MDDNNLIIYPEDVNEVVKSTDGQSINMIDIWSYCIYFAKNIQLMIGDNIYDGMPLDVFGDIIEKDQKSHLKTLYKFVEDKRIYMFQQDMATKYGVKVNAWALCTLCEFINVIIHKKVVLLLKPTPSETIEQIKDFESVTFHKKNRKVFRCNNDEVLKVLKDAINKMERKPTTTYEAYKVVDRLEVFTKEILQIEFTYYLSAFFNQYYNIKRKGKLTSIENRMIGYFLKWFGLSVEEVTESRLRQLRMNYDKFDTTVSFLNLGASTLTVQWHVIKYEDWVNGLINPIKKEIPTLKEGESIRFGEKLAGIELLTR